MKKFVFTLLAALLLTCIALPAQAEEAPSPENALTAEHRVYINGSNDTVRPDAQLSRAEAAVIVYSLLEDRREPAANSFADVPAGSWCQTQVDALAELDILHGYTDGTFRPDRSISRAEFLTILAGFFPKEDAAAPAFVDVEPDFWAYDSIATATARGWVNGYTDGTFRPYNPVTRAEAIVMTNRALGRSADRAALDSAGKPTRFADLPVTHWAYYDVMEAALPHTPAEEGPEEWLDYSIPASTHGDGMHLINGSLYLCEGGQWVHDRTDGVLTFGPDGRYTSGSAELDKALTDIILRQGGIVAGDRASLQRLYNHVVHDYGYRGASMVDEGTQGWEPAIALEMATVKMGNCYRYTALFAMLARQCGFQATGVAGQVNFNTGYGWGEHSWVEIQLDGSTWLCDPDVEMAYPRMDMFMRAFGDVEPSYRLFGEPRGRK